MLRVETPLGTVRAPRRFCRGARCSSACGPSGSASVATGPNTVEAALVEVAFQGARAHLFFAGPTATGPCWPRRRDPGRRRARRAAPSVLGGRGHAGLPRRAGCAGGRMSAPAAPLAGASPARGPLSGAPIRWRSWRCRPSPTWRRPMAGRCWSSLGAASRGRTGSALRPLRGSCRSVQLAGHRQHVAQRGPRHPGLPRRRLPGGDRPGAGPRRGAGAPAPLRHPAALGRGRGQGLCLADRAAPRRGGVAGPRRGSGSGTRRSGCCSPRRGSSSAPPTSSCRS